jgi:DNA-binding NarL/FixJ family response regulator
MPSRHSTSPDDYSFRPPLFTREEWRRIVEEFMLSRRHAEVLGLAIQSNSDKQIAAKLGITSRTVRDHLNECKNRLDATDRMNLFYRVVEMFRRLSK